MDLLNLEQNEFPFNLKKIAIPLTLSQNLKEQEEQNTH